MLESEFKDTLRFVNEDNGTLLVFLSSLTVDRTSCQRLPDYEANCPCPSERVQRITISFNQDVVYAVTNGLEKTPKHVLLPYAIKSLTGNVELIHTLNRFGYGISYSKLEELDTALCLQKLSLVENEVCVPFDIHPQIFTTLAWDNIDRLEETLSGGTYPIGSM
ncbi:hypothetical protein GQR58_011368 [Nymphon striatum]|nr:hypothetical protein GQR58_011368 [Nymphon striatum]